MSKIIKIQLKRSLIGCTKYQRSVLAALGLSRREQIKRVVDNAANRGQIMIVQHMLDVSMEN